MNIAMNQLVIYADYLRPRDDKRIRQAVPRYEPSPLPMDVGPVGQDAEWSGRLETLRKLEEELAPRLRVILQPPEAQLPARTMEDAIAEVKRSDPYASLAMDAGEAAERIQWASKEYPRCWAILAQVPGWQLPPGMGFLLDKLTLSVFPRRYVDLEDFVLTTKQVDVLERFEELLEGIDAAWQGDSAEPAMVALLEFVKLHAEAESAFREAFVQMASGSRRGPLDALAFCMHELRWPEVRAAAKKSLAVPDPRSMNLLGHLVAAYEDDWEDRVLYEYFAGRIHPQRPVE